MSNSEDGLRVGELALASGLSIRTVRYYDQIGLLTPHDHQNDRRTNPLTATLATAQSEEFR